MLDDFSVLGAFALGDAFSAFDGFALADDLSVFDPFEAVDVFSVVDALGFLETFPFVEDVPLFDGVAFGADDVFPFEAGADTVAESAADLGAVSGFTAGAHALAMTIAISGIRARPVISSLVEGHGERRRSGPAYLTPRAHRRYPSSFDGSAVNVVYQL